MTFGERTQRAERLRLRTIVAPRDVAALDVLEDSDTPIRNAMLEAAARQLAVEALRDVTGQHLETLGGLRRLLDGDRTATTQDQVRSGLLAALPAPPRPIVPTAPR